MAISINKPDEDDINNMEWHIITSSKGGVGKTLLTLLLSARSLESGKTPLVIDLNAMNADSVALLSAGAVAVDPHYKTEMTINHQRAADETEQLGAENIYLKKINSFYHGDRNPIQYVIGWPSNPYNLYKPSLFADFLCTIKNNLSLIHEEMGLKIETIIIDTSYHFTNLFSQHEHYYKIYQENFQDDQINIWFLWVYRQLSNFIHNSAGTDKVYRSANMIEQKLQTSNTNTSIMHVTTPVSLTSSSLVNQQANQDDNVRRWPLLSLMFASQREGVQERELVIEGLDKMDEVQRGEYKSFQQWVSDLINSYNLLRDDIDIDQQSFFLQTLIKALKDERPMNVIPLWDYHPELQRYTDRYAADPLRSIMQFKIYENFKKLMQQ